MKQFAYSVYDSNDLKQQLQEVRSYLDTARAASVITHIYSGHTERARIESVLGVLGQVLPESLVVGATAGGEILAGRMTPLAITIVVSIFETTTVEVTSYQFEPGEEEQVGAQIRDAIDATSDIRGAELLVDCARISTARMFPAINECFQHVKIFGAVPYAHDLKKPMYVFTDDFQSSATVILATYAGADFRIETDHVIGWKPMGSAMRITRATGSVLNELDGKPALAVYDKYLQIPNDEHFYENAFEFPFLRYINDTYMMRLPYAGLPDGSIELRAPVNEGDVMYLSYGDMPTIVSEVLEARGRMERFHPQYIRLHNCATRKTFWGPDINRETEPFQQLADTNGFFTGGEILRVNGRLVHFNATLVVVGMREGEPDPQQLLRMSTTPTQDEIDVMQASMVRRMAHFINVAMQEVLDSNRQLDILAKTDELTGLLNRREMGRIITALHDEHEPFCLVMADLDDFKNVNDTYGHDVGDVVLSDVAGLIRGSIEGVEGAAAGRWGGEEFMVLLPHTSLEAAHQIAEGLRARIEAFKFSTIDQMTISLGVADSDTYGDMKSIYHDVDRALYAAKAAGKNEVVLVSSLE